jgi:predicted nucleic acid-binding protein
MASERELLSDLEERIKSAEREGNIREKGWYKVKEAADAVVKVNPENVLGNRALEASCLEIAYIDHPFDQTLRVGVMANRLLRKTDRLTE